MRRRFTIFALCFAWFCANGAAWNLVQLVGWTKMLHDNAQVMSLAQAVQTTFDGSKPCNFCLISQAAQKAARDQEPVTAALGDANGKIVLIAEFAPAFEMAAPVTDWPGLVHETGSLRTDAVPVPPPRA